MMDLDELQSVQSRERQTDSLQPLRESFYREAGEFIEQLRRERDRAAEQADDPWDAPEVSRLTDDIDTAESTVEAVYERRVGKIVKMASLAAADMPTEDEGLTVEERDLFDTLVDAIEHNRMQVEAILDGEDPASVNADEAAGDQADGALSQHPDAEPSAREVDDAASESDADAREPVSDEERVDAADLMGGGSGPTPPADERESPADEQAPPADDTEPTTNEQGPPANDTGPAREEPNPPGADTTPARDSETTGDEQRSTDDPTTLREDVSAADAVNPDPVSESGQSSEVAGQPESSSQPGAGQPDASGGSELDAVERETVRIVDSVGEIYGVDDRQYELAADDVVTLPADNAKLLVERDAAERLD